MPEPLPRRRDSYYELLGVSRNAKLTDITRAYNRHRSEVRRDDRPPDLKRETLLREAYETLSDPDRRDAYDASLAAPERRHRSRMRAIAFGTAGIVVAAAALLWLRPQEAPPAAVRAPGEVLAVASVSVGSLNGIDLSGRTTRAGLAFAIGDKVFVGSCRGFPAGSQIVVRIPPRAIPVRLLSSDEGTGLCRLVSEGIGARPLEAATEATKTGDLVYGARATDAGALLLTQGRVQRVDFQNGARVLEVKLPEDPGAPLLDANGRVVAVAMGDGKHVPIPAAWIREAVEPFEEPKPPVAAAEPTTKPAAPPGPGGIPKTIDDIPPERREKLEKAFVPPPPDKKDDWMK